MFRGGGQASSNWRYLTEDDRQGPRKDDMMFSTTYAKDQFKPFLTTRDIECIPGYRRPPTGGRYGGSTQTMYYEKDLVDYVTRQVGQERFNRETSYGREKSGVAQQERDQAAREQAAKAQVAADQQPHAVVPAERLINLGHDKLQAIMARCEGGKLPPYEKTKAGCIERILKAGYSVEKEMEAMAKEKKLADEEAARRAAAREAHLIAEAKRQVEAAAKAKRDEEVKQERARQFAAGELAADELKYQELLEQCKLHGVTGKQMMGKKKPEVLEMLRAATKRAAAEAGVDENGGQEKRLKA